MVFCVFIFGLEPKVRKNTWMKTNFVTVMVFFFKSTVLKITWSQLFSGSFLNNYKAHWQQHLKSTLQWKILRKWIKICANPSWINILAKDTFNKILSRLSIMKQYLTKVPLKLSVVQKFKLVLQKALHQNQKFSFFFIFLFLSNNPRF